MLPYRSLCIGLILAGATSAVCRSGMGDSLFGGMHAASTKRAAFSKRAAPFQDLSRVPLSFESNHGQTDGRVRFLAHRGDSTLFLTPTEAVFTLPAQPSGSGRAASAWWENRKRRSAAVSKAWLALRMHIVGANPGAGVLTEQPLPGQVNYLVGNDRSRWQTGIPTFGRVGFHNAYPGIDLVYYGNQRRLEYDFRVAPHADPKQIRLQFSGAQQVRVDAAGNLIVRIQGQELIWRKPSVYQQECAGKRTIAAHFLLRKLTDGQTQVRFALGRYDSARALVIDPILLYSTYLTGSQSQSNTTEALGIAVDGSGNAYITGDTHSTSFPTSAGVFQPGNNSQNTNAFVTKLNPAGTAIVYSTYLGGSGMDGASCIAVDSSGNAFVGGHASSTDFPTTAGAYQRVNNATSMGSGSAFIAKLNATGTALLYSTYLGGSTGTYNNTQVRGIAIDSSGAAYVTGMALGFDLPVTPGAFQTVKTVGWSESTGFVTKLNPAGSALVYSTYLGGSGSPTAGDIAHAIAIDSSGNAYVTGATWSSDFPTTANAFQRTGPGVESEVSKAFVTKLNPTGTALVYSTYLGGSATDASDHGYGIAVDSTGAAYVAGAAASKDFPTTPGVFQPAKRAGLAFVSNAFVTKLNPAGTGLVYSTFVGGNDIDTAYCIAIDSAGEAYIAGSAESYNFPTTPGAFQRKISVSGSGAMIPFFCRLNPTGTALIYSTYLSGTNPGFDQSSAVAIDRNGVAYIAGITGASDFPTTAGALQAQKPGQMVGDSGFVTKLSPVSLFPDFNNDGSTDLLIQNPSTGAIAGWYMQGTQQVGSASFSLTPPAEYALVGAGDFAGAGSISLVLQSSITNQIALWFTSGANNATISGGHFVNVTPDAGWKVVGVGDFNGDGISDLLFQNQNTRQLVVWFMNGYLDTGGVLLPYSPLAGWSVVGVGDFNADGRPDIVFQNQTTGQLAIWYLNGTNYLSGAVLTAMPASGWKVAGVGDYNGDGYADLLFQNPASSQAVVWYLKNGALSGGAALSAALPSGWKIVGPR